MFFASPARSTPARTAPPADRRGRRRPGSARRTGRPRACSRRAPPRWTAGSPAARPGHAEPLEEHRVPLEIGEVAEERARGVGRIRHVRAAARPAGQVPDDPGVDRAEQQTSRGGELAHLADVVEEPPDLRRREVGRDRKPRAPAHVLFPSPLDRRPALGCGARVLPDDRVRGGAAVARVPGHDGLALVGDPDREHAPRRRRATASETTSSTRSRISSGSCSTQPGCGKICSCSR